MEKIRIGGRELRFDSCEAAVVGAGAAGLNAADELKKGGADVLLIADDPLAGTSRNAGSDKQTYYKLSLAGAFRDSAEALARTYFACGSMHGDTAYALAAGSARAFFKLTELGVPFPQNELGEFAGYQTDHDESLRATSAGPLTSRYMVSALQKSVESRGVKTLWGAKLVSILKDDAGAAAGLLLLDGEGAIYIAARRILLATGGPARAYFQTVYPESQIGATGALIRAGAKTNNLCYWQYGLASVKVRWNVSGSYQQAIPAYTDGTAPFLAPFFAGEGDMLDSVFLKGYQWPFDARKRNGSSRVDAAVSRWLSGGGRAFLDFRRADDALSAIGQEARDYLRNCGALLPVPIERLNAINPEAIEFYRSRGIDLYKEPLEIAVCAQHCNGGAAVDPWWRSSVTGLYAAGECAGAFGKYRPGGSALNETQVGSLRAAQNILARPAKTESAADALRAVSRALSAELRFLDIAAAGGFGSLRDCEERARRRMDAVAGAVRDAEGMRTLRADILAALGALKSAEKSGAEETGIGEARDYAEAERAVIARDTLTVQAEALAAMLLQAEYGGFAGHCVSGGENRDLPESGDFAFETLAGEVKAAPLKPLPEGGGWFESVWRRYREGEVFTGD